MEQPFPFPSLLPRGGNRPFTLQEISVHLGVSEQHLVNLIEAGELVGLDLARHPVRRSTHRVPVEGYKAYLALRLSDPRARAEVLQIPTPALCELLRDVAGRLVVRGIDPLPLLK